MDIKAIIPEIDVLTEYIQYRHDQGIRDDTRENIGRIIIARIRQWYNWYSHKPKGKVVKALRGFGITEEHPSIGAAYIRERESGDVPSVPVNWQSKIITGKI
jgi:hypothetical protein